LANGSTLPSLHRGGPWIPTLELVYYSIQKGPMDVPLSRKKLWFNKKHPSTRMNVERGFGILKAMFKEIGTKSS
jgi:hypothetical protein